MEEYIIGVDLGGTRLRATRFDHNLNMLARDEVLTLADQGLEATLGRIKTLIRAIAADVSIQGIGVSVPGPTNPYTGIVVAPPNLAGWHNVPLKHILEDEFGAAVYLGNDANVAALAEVVRGAAQGYGDAIFITISTGIGGGIICDGRMLLGKEGLGAEVGHIVMVVDERVSTLEKEAAGPALARKARARLEAGAESQIRDLVGGNLSLITGATVGIAAQAGDPLAVSIIQHAGRIVGYGMASLLHVFNPEILIFGGGVTQVGSLLFEPMWDAIKEACIDAAYWRDLKIVMAGLGENVSLYGAGALVLTKGGVENVRAVKAELEE
jgi:glucokinase